MTKVKIYVDISPDGLYTLQQNKVRIEHLLEAEGIECDVEEGFVRYESQEGFRSKDIVPIIIASSAAIASIGFAISKIIATLNNKKQVIILEGLEEIRDKDNNPIYDKEGKPVFKTVKRIEVVDSSPNPSIEYFIKLFKVFSLRILSK